MINEVNQHDKGGMFNSPMQCSIAELTIFFYI